MDSVKNWCRSRSMSFGQNPKGSYAQGNVADPDFKDFKTQSYGPTDRAMKSASDVCKKLTPSTDTKASVNNAVENVKEYGRKLIPNEATKQKVSRFYESQVAKLKYNQLKDGFHPGDRAEDCSRLTEDDSFFGTSEVQRRNFDDQEVPSSRGALGPTGRLRTSSLGERTSGNQEWKGSFMHFRDTGRRAL